MTKFDKLFKTLARLILGSLCLGLLGACSSDEDPESMFRAGDFDEAYEIFSERAETGDLAAINFLGIHYYLGAGVKRDFDEAAKYFQHAALGNNAHAQRNLGIMYMRGLGVPQDNHRAYGWFFQAYTGGNEHARKYLQSLSDNVTPNAGGKARQAIAAEVREYGLKQQAAAQNAQPQ